MTKYKSWFLAVAVLVGSSSQAAIVNPGGTFEIKSQACSALFGTLYATDQMGGLSAPTDADIETFETALKGTSGRAGKRLGQFIDQMRAYQNSTNTVGRVPVGQQTEMMTVIRGESAIRDFQNTVASVRQGIADQDAQLKARKFANRQFFFNSLDVGVATVKVFIAQALILGAIVTANEISFDEGITTALMNTVASPYGWLALGPITLTFVPTQLLPAFTQWTSVVRWFNRYVRNNSVTINLEQKNNVQWKTLKYELDPLVLVEASSRGANDHSDAELKQIQIELQNITTRRNERGLSNVVQVQVDQVLLYDSKQQPVLVVRATAHR